MPKSSDDRPKRKVSVLLPSEDLAFILKSTNETDTRLLTRLVEAEATRLRTGAPVPDMEARLRRIELTLREAGLLTESPPKRARK